MGDFMFFIFVVVVGILNFWLVMDLMVLLGLDMIWFCLCYVLDVMGGFFKKEIKCVEKEYVVLGVI